MDMKGNVIGVTNMKLNEIAFANETGSLPQNVNFAIKASVVANFLDTHSIPYQVAQDDEPEIVLADVVEKAKKFTVQVICN